MEKYIELNVRGTILKTERKLLTSVPDSALEAMFSGRHEPNIKDGRHFLDRDPTIFKHLLWTLKNGHEPYLSCIEEQLLLDDELDFWGLPSLLQQLQSLFDDSFDLRHLLLSRILDLDFGLHVETKLGYNRGLLDYHGQVSSEGRPHGIGKLCWKDGKVYEGQIRKDKYRGIYNGYGRMKYPDGSIYEG